MDEYGGAKEDQNHLFYLLAILTFVHLFKWSNTWYMQLLNVLYSLIL